MTREDWLQAIIEVVEPEETLTEETVISECDDLDSLGLFNIVTLIRQKGFKPTLDEISNLSTVGDIIDIVCPKS